MHYVIEIFSLCLQRIMNYFVSLHRRYEKTTKQIAGRMLLCPALGDVNIPYVGTLYLL